MLRKIPISITHLFVALIFLAPYSQIHAFGDFNTKPTSYIFSAILGPLIYVLLIFLGIGLMSRFRTAIGTLPYLVAILICQIGFWLMHSFILLNFPQSADISYMAISPLPPIVAYLLLLKAGLIPNGWQIFEYLRVLVIGAFLPGLLYLFIPVLLF